MRRRLEEFITALAKASSVRESAGNVGRLSIQMRACLAIATDLETHYKFNSIELPDMKRQPLSFRRLRECVELASGFYERLAYYQTTEGKRFLKGAADTTKQMHLDGGRRGMFRFASTVSTSGLTR